MILTVEEFRQHYETDESDEMLSVKLKALELMIRAYTNNNFNAIGFQQEMNLDGHVFTCDVLLPFRAGDTVQVKKSTFNDGLYTVKEVTETGLVVNEETIAADVGFVAKVNYPADVIMGVVNLMKWELERRDKVGISSETIARHSVTYADMNGDNTLVGYPKTLISFLFPYKRARFGRGCER